MLTIRQSKFANFDYFPDNTPSFKGLNTWTATKPFLNGEQRDSLWAKNKCFQTGKSVKR